MENLQGILNFAAQNQAGIIAIGTVVLVLVTAVYALFTWLLVRENRLLRQLGSDPHVIAYIVPERRNSGAIEFAVTNTGRGVAFDVSMKIISGADDFAHHNVRLKSQAFFAILPHGEKIPKLLGMGHTLLHEPRLKPFNVRIDYKGANGKAHSSTYRIDITDLEGVFIGKPTDVELVEAVREISKALGKSG